VRGDLPAAGAEEAHEGPSGSRLSRAVPQLLLRLGGNPDLKAKLLARALEFSTLVDCIDDGMLRTFQELFAEFNAQLLHKP
jgi:hypothetical protein